MSIFDSVVDEDTCNVRTYLNRPSPGEPYLTVLIPLEISCIVRILNVLISQVLPDNERLKMRYTRVIIAKVALGVASEDEVFWVTKCRKQLTDCEEHVRELEKLGEIPATLYCLDALDLIRAGDTNKVSEVDHGHLVACDRCARIGQYIANMPHPEAEQNFRPLSLSA